MNKYKNVKIYVAASLSGSNGGYCAIVCYGRHYKVVSGCVTDTNGEALELKAINRGIFELTEVCNIEVITDCGYVCNMFNRHLIDFWAREQFSNIKEKEDTATAYQLNMLHNIKFVYIANTKNHTILNMCDNIATSEAYKAGVAAQLKVADELFGDNKNIVVNDASSDKLQELTGLTDDSKKESNEETDECENQHLDCDEDDCDEDDNTEDVDSCTDKELSSGDDWDKLREEELLNDEEDC